ncbi:ly6/PLAUR domain-containing protein 2-like [Pyxicephalus adspersus]|uniref:ly6/PLAUR domain-containing protein 2-like n=1 Tax=Pyxicephalus adspersus TaxID=30357 RepID=UPI003B5C9C16
MAAYTSILLLAALCMGTAYSLECYTCANIASSSNCNTKTNCTSGWNYCRTDVTSASVGISVTTITKTCALSCTASTASVPGVGSVSTSCCSTDLCNSSGANSIKSSYSAIFLLLGTIVMLISGSLL